MLRSAEVTRPLIGSVLGAVVPGLLCLVALALPMTTVGLGSSGSARSLADVVRSHQLEPFIDSRVGLWWYAVGFVGCLLVASVALPSRALVAALRAATGVAVGVSATWIAWRLTSGEPGRFGPAVWCYLAAAVLAVVAAATSLSRNTSTTTKATV